MEAHLSIVSRPADEKRGKLPRKTSGTQDGALAQLVARDIRIVEVRGSTPLCSTKKSATQYGRLISLCGHGVSASLTPAIPKSHWRGKAACDLRWRKSRRRLSQTQRPELPNGESGLLSLRTRGSTPLCSTRREALKSLDFRAFLFSPGYGGNGALALLPESAFSIVTGSIAAILHK